jgi:hypothetical protein
MGFYVNPCDCSKEEWLIKNSVKQSKVAPKWSDIDDEHLAVCLVDNLMFTAAGVAYNEYDLECFARDDDRDKIWYIVPIKKLKEVIPDLPKF